MIPINRLKEIDFLRGLAVILVLFRHFPFSFYTITMGWIGVDLFFVLSGFLVSGLLFADFQKFGEIKPGLFLIRRGFKIYPLFYAFLIFTILFKYIAGTKIPYQNLFGEIFFLQNYIGRIWNHTWSLAVEEHFYFFLTFLLYVLIKRKLLEKQKLFYSITIFIFLACLSFRIWVNINQPEQENFFESHLRFDSLFAGVLISYIYHFNKEYLMKFSNKLGKYFPLIILLFISFTPFIEPEQSFFIRTIGFTLLYLSFGLLLILTITTKDAGVKISKLISKPAFELIRKIGYYSYSIYIIHIAVAIAIKRLETLINLNQPLYFIIYFCSSILVGIVLSKLIEIPFLKLRDKYFPKRTIDLI